MGLDLLDVKFRIDRLFGVAFDPNDFVSVDEAGNKRGCTAGELCDRLIHTIRIKREIGPRVREFLQEQVRSAWSDCLGLTTLSLNEDTLLDDLLPPNTRSERWRALMQTLQIRLPRLRRPAWIEWLIAAGFVWAMGTVAFALFTHGFRESVVSSLVASCGTSVGLMIVTSPWRQRIPASCRTVGMLLDTILSNDYGRFSAEVGHFNEDEVWDVFCRLLIDILGVKREEITRDARLVEDLGAQ